MKKKLYKKVPLNVFNKSKHAKKLLSLDGIGLRSKRSKKIVLWLNLSLIYNFNNKKRACLVEVNPRGMSGYQNGCMTKVSLIELKNFIKLCEKLTYPIKEKVDWRKTKLSRHNNHLIQIIKEYKKNDTRIL